AHFESDEIKNLICAPVDPSQGLSQTLAFILQAECLLTRCSVFKDQTCFVTERRSLQQLLYNIMSEPTLQALFLSFFRKLISFAYHTSVIPCFLGRINNISRIDINYNT
ncbi:hypothetical protein, partial [uncultured Paenibacillus sp.]|uniref:hypothetical protein n=1 Tax=uncultured Paenibacillus sp. TaxID=227322 RepID=UPI002803A446